MNRSKVKQLRTEIEKALKKVGEKHKISFEIGNMTYDDHGFKASIKAIETSDPGDKTSIDKAKFMRDVVSMHGVEPEDFHREFTSQGTRFKVVGLKPRSYKYPIIAENKNGTRYKFPLRVLEY